MKKSLPLVTMSGLALVVLVILWGISPWMHWLWFDMFYLHPVGWFLALIALVTFLPCMRVQPPRYRGAEPEVEFDLKRGTLWGIFVVFAVIYMFTSWVFTEKYLANSIEPQIVTSLPDTAAVRFLPKQVAEKFGAARSQDSRIQLGDFDPIVNGTSVDWVSPREPNGFVNMITGQTDGIMMINPDGSSEVVHKPMRVGEGMEFLDNIYFRLLRQRYWVELTDVYYVTGDELLTVVPYISYSFQFPVQVPTWGGVFIVNSNGIIEDLTPAQAQADTRLKGVRLFPESLALRLAQSWSYNKGVLNAWFKHQDQIEVPELSGDNQMPFLVPGPNGPLWVTAAEPYGRSYSVSKIFLQDARTGEMQLLEIPLDSALIGPARALDYARAAFPSYSWDIGGGNFLPLEPRLYVKNGRIYWMVSVTTNQFSNVRNTVLVDASDASVRYFDSLSEFMTYHGGNTKAGKFIGSVDPTISSNEGVDLNQSQTVPPTTLSQEGLPDIQALSDEQLNALLRKIADEQLERLQR